MRAGVVAGLIGLAMPAAALAAPDAWITTKAKMALLTADGVGVAATDINVDTVDGRITLHGTVENDTEKARAEAVARDIEGATDVRNLLQVVPAPVRDAVAASDDQIRDAVTAALEKQPALATSDVRVRSVNDGVVLLGGRAATMTAHLHALQTARAVPQVRRVASEIEGPGTLSEAELNGEAERSAMAKAKDAASDAAEATGDAARETGATIADGARAVGGAARQAGGATGSAARDLWITSATKLRLLADADTPALDINVDTRDGVVTLFGIVDSEAAKQAAERDTHRVSGVTAVRNQLQVVPAEQQERVTASDTDLQQAVERAIERQPSLTDATIDVAVKDGVVRLTGTVPTQSARLAAATAARATDGVRSVLHDELRVEG
jgi:hyperosmotically inducible protein